MKSRITEILIIAIILVTVNSCSSRDETNISRESPGPNSTSSYIIEDVNFTNDKDNAHLAGTLTLPNSNEKFAAVVLISGAGLQDRDEAVYGHKPFKVLADYLTRQNIAVLRYDDRGAGESKGPLKNTTPENFAEDAYAGLQYLKSREEILTDKIGFIGHSMGAVEGSILASRYTDVSFLIMLGGAGLTLDANMLKADSVNNIRSGKSMAVVNSGQNLLKMMIAEVKKSHDEITTENNLNKIISDWRISLPEEERDGIDTFTKSKPNHWMEMASEWSTPYFSYVLNYDPFPVLSKIRCPVLSLIGEKDVQTLPAENSLKIEIALKNGKCKDYRVKIIKNLNHLFQQCETGVINEYSKIDEVFNLQVMELISNWINEQSS